MLIGAWYSVCASVLEKITARLMETEGYVCVQALTVNVKNPVEIERTRIFTGFSSDRYLLYEIAVQIWP